MVSWILGNHSGASWPPKTCVLPLMVGVGWTNSWFPSCVLSNCPKRKGWPYIRIRVPYIGLIALYKAYIRLTYCPNTAIRVSTSNLVSWKFLWHCTPNQFSSCCLLRIQVFNFKIIGIKDFRSSMGLPVFLSVNGTEVYRSHNIPATSIEKIQLKVLISGTFPKKSTLLRQFFTADLQPFRPSAM